MTAFGQISTYRSTAVLTASPGQLVLLMMDAAVGHMEIARSAFEIDDPSDRFTLVGRHLSKSTDILRELRRSLNRSKGGELAERLEGLYHFLEHGVFEANRCKDPESLARCTGILSGIRDSWREMLLKTPNPSVPPPVRCIDSAGFDVRT